MVMHLMPWRSEKIGSLQPKSPSAGIKFCRLWRARLSLWSATKALLRCASRAERRSSAGCGSSSSDASAQSCLAFAAETSRDERGSMLITADQPFRAWGWIFSDQAMMLAAINRLVDDATTLEMNGESYRRRRAVERKRRATTHTPADAAGDPLINARRQSTLASGQTHRDIIPTSAACLIQNGGPFSCRVSRDNPQRFRPSSPA